MSYFPVSIIEVKNRIAKKYSKRSLRTSLFPQYDGDAFVEKVENNFGEELVRVEGNIPHSLKIMNGDRFLFISKDQSKFTHGLHKYPAKFFPELPRWLINKYSLPDQIILDPFSGSGTTNVEAMLLGRHSVGVDVDPFAHLLAVVKTTPISAERLRFFADPLIKELINYRPEFVPVQDLPNFPYRDNWFNDYILKELSFIKKLINRDISDLQVRNFFLIVFSSVIRSVSNADDNCTRTVVRKSLNKEIYPAMALTKFVENLLLNIYRMEEFCEAVPSNIRTIFPKNSEARSIEYQNQYFDFALTSPPYANAVDYPRTHQLEIYWLDIANGSLRDLKESHVGTEVVRSSDYKIFHKTGYHDIDEVLSQIFYLDDRRSYIAYKFIMDMRANLIEVHRVLKQGAYYAVVIGNNRIRGVLFESWKYLMTMADDLGFEIESYFGSEIIKHFIKVPRGERINTDWIIILRKK
ncbi:DNA methyltransferase C1 [Ignavibacteriales bacterium]